MLKTVLSSKTGLKLSQLKKKTAFVSRSGFNHCLGLLCGEPCLESMWILVFCCKKFKLCTSLLRATYFKPQASHNSFKIHIVLHPPHFKTCIWRGRNLQRQNLFLQQRLQCLCGALYSQLHCKALGMRMVRCLGI